MCRDINAQEWGWINMLLGAGFQQKEVLEKQLSRAKVSPTYEPSFVSLMFSVPPDVEKYPFHVRVPVDMRAKQSDSTTVMFLLHVIDGLVNELEMFVAELENLDIDNIEFNHVEYDIDPDVSLSQ